MHCLLLLLHPSPLCTRGNNKLPEKHRSAPDGLCDTLLASIMAIAWSKFSLYHIQNLHSLKTSRILFAWHFAFFQYIFAITTVTSCRKQWVIWDSLATLIDWCTALTVFLQVRTLSSVGYLFTQLLLFYPMTMVNLVCSFKLKSYFLQVIFAWPWE